jgi:hypothetical protein
MCMCICVYQCVLIYHFKNIWNKEKSAADQMYLGLHFIPGSWRKCSPMFLRGVGTKLMLYGHGTWFCVCHSVCGYYFNGDPSLEHSDCDNLGDDSQQKCLLSGRATQGPNTRQAIKLNAILLCAGSRGDTAASLSLPAISLGAKRWSAHDRSDVLRLLQIIAISPQVSSQCEVFKITKLNAS